jgi:hypothetical protein
LGVQRQIPGGLDRRLAHGADLVLAAGEQVEILQKDGHLVAFWESV